MSRPGVSVCLVGIKKQNLVGLKTKVRSNRKSNVNPGSVI